MTKDGSFKKVVRRHAAETGQRYTEAKADLEGVEARMEYSPVAERLVAHLNDRYGIGASGATPLSQHVNYVMRIDRFDGEPWVARAFPPARPAAGAEGDAAILRFLEHHGYPAERLAAENAVSDFEGSSVLVTQFATYTSLPEDLWGTTMGDLLGRLHALPLDDAVARPGGAEGGDSSREGSPRQDLLAALSFLDSVDTKVVARQHVEMTAEELDRLEAVMAIRPLYLTSFAYRRNILKGWNEDALGFSDPGHLRAVADVVRNRLTG